MGWVVSHRHLHTWAPSYQPTARSQPNCDHTLPTEYYDPHALVNLAPGRLKAAGLPVGRLSSRRTAHPTTPRCAAGELDPMLHPPRQRCCAYLSLSFLGALPPYLHAVLLVAAARRVRVAGVAAVASAAVVADSKTLKWRHETRNHATPPGADGCFCFGPRSALFSADEDAERGRGRRARTQSADEGEEDDERGRRRATKDDDDDDKDDGEDDEEEEEEEGTAAQRTTHRTTRTTRTTATTTTQRAKNASARTTKRSQSTTRRKEEDKKRRAKRTTQPAQMTTAVETNATGGRYRRARPESPAEPAHRHAGHSRA